MSVVLPPDPPVPTLTPMPPWPPAPALPPGLPWRADQTRGTTVPIWRTAFDDPGQAVAHWHQLRAAHPSTGWWPLLVSESFWEAVEFESTSPPGTGATTGAEWLQERLTGGDSPLLSQLTRGDRPTSGVVDEAEMLLAFAEECNEIVLVPAAVGWLVPETLNWEGAVNHDFGGHEHTLVLRRWAGYFGAELFGQTLDEVVLRVVHPPTGAAAELAAFEAVAYCEDAVFQGSDTLDRLIPMIESPVWRFWWD